MFEENRMASDLSFVEFVVDQIQNAGKITYRKMFGEYALYSDVKVVALICDNQLFVKPTQAGKSFIDNIVETPPYPGAKLYFLIEEQIDDRDWLSQLIKLTADELPAPKPKKKKSKHIGNIKSFLNRSITNSETGIDMEIRVHHIGDKKIAEIISDGVLVSTVQDALDIMADASCQDATNMILHEKNIVPDFFDLKTGLAGEILQKFSNYHMKLAIVGNFEKYQSKSLHAFMIESNRGSHICFVPDVQTAKKKLTGNSL